MKENACRLATVLLCLGAAAVGGEKEDRDLRRSAVVRAVAKVRSAVVNISTERVVVRRSYDGFYGPGGDLYDRMFEDFFRRRGGGRVIERKKVQQPLGSGCFITSSGLVVTNEHVVRRATSIKLSLDTGETFGAELLAADPVNDLALLQAKTEKPLQVIPMGGSADLMLGETVIALGNPFGFENSVTMGIVSALNREITVGSGEGAVHYEGLVQTSALINPGNSGGPLVNVLGELVGINSAVVDHAQGIGFAIPIDRVRDKLAPLLATRRVSNTWGGVTAETAKGRTGARVTQVHAQGVLRVGDVITEISGTPVSDLFDFVLGVTRHKPGERIGLQVRRGKTMRPVRMALAAMPEISAERVLRAKCGIQGQDLSLELARHLGIPVQWGVLVTAVTEGGPAARSGLRQGDVLIQIGSHPVRNVADAGEAVMDLAAGQRALIAVVRGRYKMWARVAMGSAPPI